MDKFKILADGGCDIPAVLKEKTDLVIMPLALTIGEDSYMSDDPELDVNRFYERMIAGEKASTSQLTPAMAYKTFKKYIEEGYGVIYLALSSAITSGLNNANLAKDDLMEEFPDANIVLIDSLCACGGYGLYAYHVCKYQNEGHSMEETVKYAEELKKHEIHNFTVGDLKYLARSGRLSKGEAFLGNLANIKPVLHVDDEGRLVPLYKTHGRRKSIEGLFNDMQKRIGDYENDYLLIDHGACREDAEFLRDLIVSKTGFTNIIIDNVGPVIGAHAGPGVMTLFHLGEKR